MNTRCIAIFVAVLTGCESDAEKLQRLRTAEALGNLGSLAADHDMEDFVDSIGRIPLLADTAEAFYPRYIELIRAESAADIERDLARRDLDRFMR